MADGLSGITSGMDWGALIEKSIEKARKPAAQWEKQVDTLELKKEIYGNVSSAFYTLRNTLTTLKLETTFLKKQAELQSLTTGRDAASIMKATVKPEAAISQWNIDVKKIATTQSQMSDRVDSVSTALGLEGKFRVYVGQQHADVIVAKTDTLRDINQKIGKLKDQYGQDLAVEAMILDNHLVIKSRNSGLGTTAKKLGEKLTVAGYTDTYLPKTSDGSYAERLTSLTSGGNTYTNGIDYTYNKENGVITWLGDQRVAPGATVTAVTNNGETLTAPITENTYLPRSNTGSYPQQLLSVTSGANTYLEGTHYTYNKNDGVINWVASKKPPAGTEIDLVYTDQVNLAKTAGNTEQLPPLLSGGSFADIVFSIKDEDSIVYTQGTDFSVDAAGEITWLAGARPAANKNYTVTLGDATAYGTDYNKFYLEALDSSTVLAQMGLDKAANRVEAEDAELVVNGVTVTRSSNNITDLIANVTLDLVGKGEIVLNVTQDGKDAVEGTQKFIDAYNELMTLISDLLAEKKASTTGKDKDTVFGLFHGDPLLWSIQSQMRNLIMNPVSNISSAVATNKFIHPAASLNMTGSFYITTGGKRTRIDVAKTDSLEDIRRSVAEATNQITKDGTAINDDSMPFSVSIRNGQLVINSTSNKSGISTSTHTLERKAGRDYDYLPFAYEKNPPFDGTLTITSKGKIHTEGVDFEIVNVQDDGSKLIQSRVVWLGANRPQDGDMFNVDHTYRQNAVGVSEIEVEGGDLFRLGFHRDNSGTGINSAGITTESANYGKSGLLEFDSDKLIAAMTENPQTLSNLMTTFMRQVDTYIGNIVDSSSNIVGGVTAIKGRMASKVNLIDDQIATLTKQINNLDKTLQARQESLYKRYSDMETAMYKLSQQLSSMQSFFSASGTTK